TCLLLVLSLLELLVSFFILQFFLLKTGHFYFVLIGHFHFGSTEKIRSSIYLDRHDKDQQVNDRGQKQF
ncbi:MAG: hypothetical protein AB1782_10950, partial [Cyanobacteriota bacterium]